MISKTVFFLRRFFLFLIIVLSCYSSYSIAAEYNLIPSLGVSGEYNDNAAFDRDNEREDFLTTISPSLEFSAATSKGNISTKIAADFLRYVDETDLNTENLYAGLDAGYQITERFGISGNASYIEDTTLESELLETGLINARSDRKRYNAGVGSSYKISMTTDAKIDYDYSKTEYDDPLNEDYDYNQIKGSFNYRLDNQLDVMTLQPYYFKRESDVSKADNYGISLGWTRLFTETHSLKMFLGSRYTDLREEGESDTSWGWVADVNLMKKGENFSGDAGYSRNLHNNVSGELIEVDRIYCHMKRKIIGRLGVGFSGNLYFTRYERETDGDTRYFEVIPSLNYQLTEKHNLQLAYSYAEDDDDQAQGGQANRSRIWIVFNFNFPQKW